MRLVEFKEYNQIGFIVITSPIFSYDKSLRSLLYKFFRVSCRPASYLGKGELFFQEDSGWLFFKQFNLTIPINEVDV